MLGAMVGDIVGSFYEFVPHKSKIFPLFSEHSVFTDDTVMTLAVAEALMNGETEANYIYSMQKLARQYPDCGFGTFFSSWISSRPYNSFDNRSAMRVSPVAWFYNTLEDVENAATISAGVTYNHLEGIRGAQATAAAVFLARTGNEQRRNSSIYRKTI